MDTTAKYAEAYAQYRHKRRNARNKFLRFLIILPVIECAVIFLTAWLLRTALIHDKTILLPLYGVMWVGCGLGICMIPATNLERKRTIRKLNFEMSLTMMEDMLRDAFGEFTMEEADYRIFQNRFHSRCVEHNHRFAWLDRDAPFILHHARISNNKSADDGYVATFDGVAISIPCADGLAGDGKIHSLNRYFLPPFRKLWKNTQLSLDKFDGSRWLTIGFHKLTFVEKKPEWKDLNRWHDQCRKIVDLIRQAVDLAYATPK